MTVSAPNIVVRYEPDLQRQARALIILLGHSGPESAQPQSEHSEAADTSEPGFSTEEAAATATTPPGTEHCYGE